LQRGDVGAGLHAQLGVEVGQRLVHQEHLRLAHDGPAHRHPLPLAAGERAGLAVEELGQVEHLGRLGHLLLDLRLRHATKLETEPHVVGDGHVRVQRVGLEDHGDVAVLRGHVGDIAAPDVNGALVHLLQAGQHAKRGRLARPGGAHQHEEFAIGDFQIEAVHRAYRRSPGVHPGRILVSDLGHLLTHLSTRVISARLSRGRGHPRAQDVLSLGLSVVPFTMVAVHNGHCVVS
jgi:hypothetical protein